MEKRNVQMVALWDFAGPEGSPSGMGRGLVKKGKTFLTTLARSKVLLYSGKAKELIPIPEPKRDGPTRVDAEAPEEFRYEDLNGAEVITKVEQGVLTPERALELEQAREYVRTTVVARLHKLMEG